MASDLNQAQHDALYAVQGGKSTFLTGPAGTGKTFTLKAILRWAHKQRKRIGVTALTGSAALLLGGRTLHSYLGIGLANKTAETLAYTTMTKYRQLADKLILLDILVIDEISMADAALLDLVSAYLKIVRACDQPFGGLQLICCGDFCQLPPIDGKYCFHSEAWKELNPTRIYLSEQIRQDGDMQFQELLDRARWGALTADDLALLQGLSATTFPEHITPTRLYSLHRDVDTINRTELDKLIKAAHKTANNADADVTTVYVTEHKGRSKTHAQTWAQSCGIPATLQLVVGAQVVLTVNMSPEEGLVNGSRGYVVALEPKRVMVEWVNGMRTWVSMYTMENDDQTDMSVKYMPLKLAWAITIHKSQGMTLDAVEVDLGSSIFEYGQAYTALSRARSLKSVRVVAIAPRAFRTHPHVLEFYEHQKN